MGVAAAICGNGDGDGRPLDPYDQQVSSQNLWGFAGGSAGGQGQAMNQALNQHQQETTVTTDNEAIPDVSLIRVAKWAIVLLIAMALGEKFWAMFGPRISANLHRAIGGPVTPAQ